MNVLLKQCTVWKIIHWLSMLQSFLLPFRISSFVMSGTINNRRERENVRAFYISRIKVSSESLHASRRQIIGPGHFSICDICAMGSMNNRHV